MTDTSSSQVTVWARVCLPGFHHWPAAPERRSYLTHRHRHLFHITVEVEVSHIDRDVEFHDLAAAVTEWWGPGDREWGATSCELIALELSRYLHAEGLPVVAVTVSEDGEAGATIRQQAEEAL